MTGIPHVQACPNLIGTNPSREIGWPKPVKTHGLATVQVLLQQNGAIHGILSTDTLAPIQFFPHPHGGLVLGKSSINGAWLPLPCLMKLMASLLVREKNPTVLDESFLAPKIAICRTRISGFSQPIVIVRTDTSRNQIRKKKVLFSTGTLA